MLVSARVAIAAQSAEFWCRENGGGGDDRIDNMARRRGRKLGRWRDTRQLKLRFAGVDSHPGLCFEVH